MRIPVLLTLLLSLASAPAVAQMPDLPRAPEPGVDAEEARRVEVRDAAWRAYAQRVARALGRSDGSRDLALAALVGATAGEAADGERVPANGQIDGWRADAAARGASDVITQQLLLAAAHAAGDRDAALAAAGRWESLAPGNLAPLMHQGLDAITLLEVASQSSHNAPDPYPALRWMASALAAHPPTATEWAAFGEGPLPSAKANAAVWTGSLQGLLLPDYRDVLAVCTGRPLGVPGRAEACAHLARLLLARPQTVLDERIGLSLARAVTRTASERAPLDARRRGVDWRQEQLAEMATRADADAAMAAAERQAQLLADPAIDTEDAMVRRILAAAGLAQEPPTRWRAPWERAPR